MGSHAVRGLAAAFGCNAEAGCRGAAAGSLDRDAGSGKEPSLCGLAPRGAATVVCRGHPLVAGGGPHLLGSPGAHRPQLTILATRKEDRMCKSNMYSDFTTNIVRRKIDEFL